MFGVETGYVVCVVLTGNGKPMWCGFGHLRVFPRARGSSFVL